MSWSTKRYCFDNDGTMTNMSSNDIINDAP